MTVLPSGERLGEVSSPAASVMRVKVLHRASAGAARGIHHVATAPAIATPAIVHGSHALARAAIAPRPLDPLDPFAPVAGVAALDGAFAAPEPIVESVSSAKPRSVADWNRTSTDFSRHRRTTRSSPGEMSSAETSRSGGSTV